jgi:gluconokinase
LQENEKELFAQAHKFISIKEFIWWQMFGEYVVDQSLASATGLFNVLQLQWEKAALDFAGISAQQLSLAVPVTYTKTSVKYPEAETMALPAGTPFIIGASDGTLANLGSLCLRSTEAAVTIGTSAAVRLTLAKPVQDAERMIFNYRLDEKTFVCGGATNNGGNVFQWLLEDVFAQHKEVTSYETLFNLIHTVTPGSNALLFLPYLHGERAPVWDEKSSAAFIGVNATHGLPHFARAAAEGVCFALKHILSSLEEVCEPVEQLYVSGGLVHSAVMMQLLANVTGKKVLVQQNGDASAVGAVYLAQKALGLLADYNTLPAKKATEFLPQETAVMIYRRYFAVYKNLYPLLKNSLRSLHSIAR